MNSSKATFSVMFMVSAAGGDPLVMVVYKADNLYESWKRNGPKGCFYSHSPSGWFDIKNFELFFFEVALPHMRRKTGKKLMIGDNASTYFSPAIIEACRRHDIAFVSLPPNATHLMQPLDVAVFKPVKAAWSSVLSDYKKKHPKDPSIGKADFPSLLAATLKKAPPGQYMAAGFRRCGLYPLNIEEVTRRLPDANRKVASTPNRELLDATFSERLAELRGVDRKENRRKRGKKITPGKDMCEEEEEEEILPEELLLGDQDSEDNKISSSDSEEEYRRLPPPAVRKRLGWA